MLLLPCSAQKNNGISTLTLREDIVISEAIIGNGVEWSAYPHGDAESAEWGLLMTDEKWERVFKRLDFMKPQIVRVLDQANWRYLKGFDTANDPIVDFESKEMQALYKLLDYCEENNVTVILGEWGQPYKVHDTQLDMQDKFSGANDPKWINLIVGHLSHLINNKGYTCIKYYNLVNEPNGYWSSVDGNWQNWKEGVIMLNNSIIEEGLVGQIKIIGPDATPYNNEKSKFTGREWAIESVFQLDTVLGAYDVHDYPTKEYVRSGNFQKDYSKLIAFADSVAPKPFFLGEVGLEKYVEPNIKRYEADPYASSDSQMSVYDYDYGVDMADVLAQSMNSGFDATIAWGLDDAMHTNGDTGDRHQLKRWGMWNSLGSELTGDPNDEEIRPWFYTWALMTRYYPSGTKIIKMDGEIPKSVRVVAGIYNDALTMTLVNNSEEDHSFHFELYQNGDQLFTKYVYTEDYRAVNKNYFPKPISDEISVKGDYMIKVPAKSVILLTSIKL